MEGEIVNKVANSALMVFDMEDFYPTNPRLELDIAQWLYEGFILREKDFRAALKDFDWTVYTNAYVALYCSTDAILPAWAFMLVTSYLQPLSKQVFLGDKKHLESSLYQGLLDGIDYSIYDGKATIIKGCSKHDIPEEAYIIATQKLMKHARSVMFGEACSAVPIFKKKV
ncbi:DUF2480 family protein [Flavobacterium sp. JP2137]|uniref:DUF2480 family protein n=1 Tax=Flavobacterium sp. JP2137 TaxID=3414510 RepID=UPI003D2FC1ED